MERAYDSTRLAQALDFNHPCSGDNTCDIAKAVSIGCYLWAGHLLGGATECDETNEAMAEINEQLGATSFEQELELERRQLLEEPHLDCESCGAIVWTDDGSTVCDNCGEEVHAAPGGDHGCASTRAECQPEGDHPNETPCSCSCHNEEE